MDKTPFDNFEDNIILQVIDTKLTEIYSLINNNPQITRQYVEEVIEPVEESLNQLHNKVDQLLKKEKNIKKHCPFETLSISIYSLYFLQILEIKQNDKKI